MEGFCANSLSWSSLLLRKETRAETIDTATSEVPVRRPGTGIGARAQRRMRPSVFWALRRDVQCVSFNYSHNSWNRPRPRPPTLERTQNTTHSFFPPPPQNHPPPAPLHLGPLPSGCLVGGGPHHGQATPAFKI